ncbi:MAG: cytosolic protein, partial [Chlorobium sp.]
KERVIKLFAILDWLMQLPAWLNHQILDQIETIEEGNKVQYITSVERIGMARGEVIGIEKGVVIGVEKGVVIGVVIGASGLLRRQLQRRFGVLPGWVSEQLSSASEQELEAWADAILTAPTLEAVFNAD